MTNVDTARMAIMGRIAVYRTLQMALANEPCTDVMTILSGDELTVMLEMFGLDTADAIDLKGRAGEVMAGGQPAMDALEASYNRLFVGPTILEAAPWESIYKTTDNVLFCETTLEVRKAYVAQGFIPNGYPNVADDHVAIELDFMRLLSEQTLEFLDADNARAAREKLSAQASFLENHLNAWLPKFSKKVAGAEHGSLYRDVVAIARDWARADAELVQELLAAL